MRIITTSCPACGTVVAANELESRRVMKCPGLGCEQVLRFEDLSRNHREFFLENREQYRLQDEG
jgi:DNA-directed RNA polymerase subunit M/transcription elongation factor TFIIS